MRSIDPVDDVLENGKLKLEAGGLSLSFSNPGSNLESA